MMETKIWKHLHMHSPRKKLEWFRRTVLVLFRQLNPTLLRSVALQAISIVVLCSLLSLAVPGAQAFSLLGPLKNQANDAPDPWQGRPYGGRPGGLGYGLPTDIGGPMFLNEAYRWNVPVITYGFDRSFVDYFGQSGVDAIEEALGVLSALPPASEMSPGLTEFPLDAKGENASASAYGVLDLKSCTLALLVEQMGLANPERFVWGLRARTTFQSATQYSVVNEFGAAPPRNRKCSVMIRLLLAPFGRSQAPNVSLRLERIRRTIFRSSAS